MTKTAILQSNYIPWKGYFDIINAVDQFVIYDSAQYTKNDWRNRNQVKTRDGLKWLTIPVAGKGGLDRAIRETRISDPRWSRKHWKLISQSYAKAACFSEYSALFERLYVQAAKMELLSDVNMLFIKTINEILGIDTIIRQDNEFDLRGGKSERLLNICLDCGADCYLSGPAARDYLDTELFAAAGVKVEWMDYSGYPSYDQLFPPFEHAVSVLDLIFNTGANARNYLLNR